MADALPDNIEPYANISSKAYEHPPTARRPRR